LLGFVAMFDATNSPGEMQGKTDRSPLISI